MKKYLVILPIVASCSGLKHSSNMGNPDMDNPGTSSQGEESNNQNKSSLLHSDVYSMACHIIGINGDLTLEDVIKNYCKLIKGLNRPNFLPTGESLKEKFLANLIEYLTSTKGQKINRDHLDHAIKKKATKLLEALLNYTVDLKDWINDTNKEGVTLLGKLLKYYNPNPYEGASRLEMEELAAKLIKILMDLGADVTIDAYPNDGFLSALETVIEQKNIPAIKVIKQNLDLTNDQDLRESIILFLIKGNHSIKLLETLLGPNYIPEHVDEIFGIAMAQRNHEFAKILISTYKANPNNEILNAAIDDTRKTHIFY